jgi:predicted metal-dependent hydrolase
MAQRQFVLDQRTTITIYKRKKSRNLRLSITTDGSIRVSIPAWAPYSAGIQFAKSRQAWINSQRPPGEQFLQHGQRIGKAHRLHFVPTTAGKVTSRIRASEVLVSHPSHLPINNPAVQKTANQAAIKALRVQAEQLLLKRLHELADRHGFNYTKVTVKRLKSRWGSCDQAGNIVLNLFLMQLPWDCIDYVLLHELTHTRLMRHGPDFWRAMETVLPEVASVRKAMRGYQPILDRTVS